MKKRTNIIDRILDSFFITGILYLLFWMMIAFTSCGDTSRGSGNRVSSDTTYYGLSVYWLSRNDVRHCYHQDSIQKWMIKSIKKDVIIYKALNIVTEIHHNPTYNKCHYNPRCHRYYKRVNY